MATNATSPAASGPAGSHFEGQVGAHYLLSMLVGAEPRGLPGTTIARAEFQRAAEGHPLDDVIMHAQDPRGDPSVLEIQVKRTITFAPGDTVFRDAVAQIAEASRKPGFWTRKHELAIATARTSRQIAGPYQDVLTWARQLGDAATFMARIARPNSGNDEMRNFVRTFATRLGEAGAPNDDESVWKLLRRVQILVFDFTAPGSASAELARERAVRALHPDESAKAASLWSTLVELAIRVAASGGDRAKDALAEYLREQKFRLSGERKFSTARSALAEASRNALADIRDRVGDVMLTRHERTAAVHAALDSGRYLEIRGDAGVGKSGILKHAAEQFSAEGQVVVLSPGRTPPGGWTAMRAMIGFDGSARDLLSDLAGDGGAVLFLDNLDFFNDGERKTVIDLVRDAAKVPGFAVIATGRRDFGVEEPSWLPSDALEALGRAEPVVIGDLSESELEELRQASPRLAALLADTHPARDVIRNLFRLARLASREGTEPVPRTECDMALQWWQTADGSLDDAEHRVRFRLLRTLAEQVVERGEPLDVREHEPTAVDSLIRSETLRDLRSDRVAFRHDVLREWAIANLLHIDAAVIERLPLEKAAPAALSRGTELAARMAIERAADGAQWQALLERLSRDGVHSSWRRAVLLALVRSEIGPELLTRVSPLLFADGARVLREIIRLVMAVDVEPASKVFAAIGIDPGIIPSSLNVPNNPSWQRLIIWLLRLEQGPPAAAIPDIVDLYAGWSGGMLGQGPLTPFVTRAVYRWLTELEAARHPDNPHERREPFGGGLEYEQLRALEPILRTGFLMFCHRTPELAVEYLESLKSRRHGERISEGLLTFRGSLAQAAPAQLAELTANALIPKPRTRDLHRTLDLDGPFDFLDHKFLPASPAQGPFFELLLHAPQHGLALIHRLVNHAISLKTGGRNPEGDVITISLSSGDRAFPWKWAYAWSRDGQGPYSVTSALMALEAWAHKRIEAGEAFETVLADVLGPPNSPAAFLLVAVDLLLSHWPKSREAAVPFVACPELLCIDQERYQLDNFEYPDLLGLPPPKEPAGLARVEDLKKRASRRVMLGRLLDHYAVFGPAELREKLEGLLRTAVTRLGPYDGKDTLGNPTFMAAHALNRVDPANYPESTETLPDGTQRTGCRYESPSREREHFAALATAAEDGTTNITMQMALGNALDDPARSSPELASAGAKWARGPGAVPDEKGKDEEWMREQAVMAAAMIVMRDGDAELRAKHGDWARGIFAQALLTKDDPVHRVRGGLRFNPIAIAFAGMIYVLKDRGSPADVRALLEVAGRENPAAAHGLGAAAAALASFDERLPRAVLRCAFAACIRASRKWDLAKEEVTARAEDRQKRLRDAIDAEVAWLGNEGNEPGWPPFPSKSPRRRGRIRLPGGVPSEGIEAEQPRPEEYADHHSAALWLGHTRSLGDAAARPWLRNIAQAYASWTADANGSGLKAHDDVDDPPREWNDAYFGLLARCLPGLSAQEIEQVALRAIANVPDEAFFDLTTDFLRSVDAVYFNGGGLDESTATAIRATLGRRMMATHGWERLRDDRSGSIERHIGSAIAVLFFNDYNFVPPPKCYLYAKGIDRIENFIPILGQLAVSGPSLFVAIIALNLLEVSVRPSHLPFLVAAARAWLGHYPSDSTFWVDHGIGARVCRWIENVHEQDPTVLNASQPVRRDVDRLLAGLVTAGVAEARRLEDEINKA